MTTVDGYSESLIGTCTKAQDIISETPIGGDYRLKKLLAVCEIFTNILLLLNRAVSCGKVLATIVEIRLLRRGRCSLPLA